ncbi:MAG: phosphoribosylformylglycinamidine synthase subunit PurL [Candidatus Syntropharchaeia archaeon]
MRKNSRYVKRPVPFELYEIDILDANDNELLEISSDLGLALDLDEMKRIKSYFSSKKRNPTDIELHSIAQAWSEHCCYKSSKNILKEFIFGIEAPQNILVIKEDAGVVEFDEEYAYVVALESHNHPSAIEPYGGAATGIGGIVRDVVCMGAQPIALIDPLFFGPLDLPYEKLPKGTRHPKYLFSGVVSGISDYGNRIGIPTTAGMIYFDEGYIGNCLVNVGCVGIVRKDRIVRSAVKEPGDVLILVGGKTGRDGIHGVTFASTELGEEPEESRSAVQLGDPITKEPLIHACLEANERGLLQGMKDLGGGGLSCVVGEMAFAGGFGAQIELDEVPLKEEGLSPWEIWISESQERFMLAVKPANVKKVIEIFDGWDIETSVIGGVIPDKKIIIRYRGELIFDMDVDFLVSGPVYNRACEIKRKGKREEEIFFPEPEDYSFILLSILSSENVCSREWVIRQYDHEVRGCTVIKPLQGKIGREIHGDSAVIKPLEESFRGLALSSDVNPSYTRIDPFWGSASAVDEVCRNLSAVGARPHSLADCLNFGNPEKPERMGDFYECCRGLGYVARSLGIPFVSGNVSFYNETGMGSVPPTPTVLGIGIVEDVRKCITVDLKGKGNPIYVIGETKRELGGSEYFKILRISGGNIPKVDPEILRERIDALLFAIKKGFVLSCHDISEGGIGVCISEMVIGSDLGAEIDLKGIGNIRSDYKLFSESNTRWIVEIDKKHEDEFKEEFTSRNIDFYRIGVVEGKDLVIRDGERLLIDVPVRDLRNSWIR